jgi:methylphosphotriester-DNA--protein-cysteine methyltransferase
VKRFRLIGPDGEPFDSPVPGTLGGHRRSRIYGRLDCPSALAAIRRGGPYAGNRVFFADAASAEAAGYRPCGRCMREAFRAWQGAGAEG